MQVLWLMLGIHIDELCNKINGYFPDLSSFFTSRNLTLAPTKSPATLFTTWRSQISTTLNIHDNGITLQTVLHPKILVMTFDQDLNFGKHAAAIVPKIQSRNKIFKYFAGSTWGKDKERLFTTYKAIGQPIACYASQIWSPSLKTALWKKVQACQNTALRTATGCLLMSPEQHLHNEAKRPHQPTPPRGLRSHLHAVFLNFSDDSNARTYFENRRTHFNSMHEINEERVSGCEPAQQDRARQPQQQDRFPPSPRQYAPEEFDLCEDEQFQHPRMFGNLSYKTDAAALEAMRAQNARPRYQQQPRFNISDLPSQQLEDFSDPQFSGEECNVCSQQQQQQQQQHQIPNISDISAPDFCDVSDAAPWPERTPQRRSQSPRRQQQQMQQESYPDECLDDESAPMYESPIGTPTPQFHYSPIQLMNTPDICVPTPQTPTPPPYFSPIRFQPSPVRYPSEHLEDVSVPSYPASPCDVPTPPSPARVQTPQNLPSDMLRDVSMPSFRSPPTPSISFPSEMLDELTMPSFENASCGSPLDRRFLLDSRLADESPPSFTSSGPSAPSRRLSTPCRPPSPSPARVSSSAQRVFPTPRLASSAQQSYEPTPQRRRPQRRFNLAELMSQRSPNCTPSRAPSPCTPTPPAPQVSMYSPMPVGGHPMPIDLPSERLTDISEPAYFSGPPRTSPPCIPQNLPSECLGDISEPSFQMTPPARTPSLPHDLTSKQLCDMTPPLYQSPASEHLASMSMPSFEDTSCGSPLDRRFLLDRRLMDESPPTFASSLASSPRGSSPCRTPSQCPNARQSSPYPQSQCVRSRSAPLQRTLPAPCFSPSPRGQRIQTPSPVYPPAPRFSLCSPSPIGPPTRRAMQAELPDECLMNVSEPAYFNSPPRPSPTRRSFSSMTNECLADISAPSYEMTPPPRTPSLPHDLPSDMICDMSQPMYQSPASEHLSGESMPSFADTSCGSPLDRRFLLDPCLADESMPSMVSSRSPSPTPRSPYVSNGGEEPSFDQTYCEILARFNSLKCKINSPQATSSPGQSSPGEGSDQAGECIRETVVERTENENGQLESTTQHIVVTVDPCGSIRTHTKEVKTQFPQPTPQRLLPPSADSGVLTQTPRPGAHIENLRNSVRRRLSFNLSDMPNENLADMSLPCDDELPSMDTENMLQNLSSIPQEQLMNISAPSYRTPPTPSISYPSERLDAMSMPSFENASCGSPLDRRFLLDSRLADESPPTFASSYGASPPRSQGIPQQQSPYWQTPYAQLRMLSSTPSRYAQDSYKTIGSTRQDDPSAPSPRRFAHPESPYPPAPQFSLHSPTPVGSPPRRPLATNLPNEQLTDISEPAYFSSPPRASLQRRPMPSNLPSERLDDISQPSYERTPPPLTPRIPSSLPSEMLGNISAPSYRSPASEHISSISMPSFADVSYESPLDRRFLLDPRLADESMPTLPGTPSTPYTTDSPRPGSARRRLSYSQPDSRRGSDNRQRDSPFRSSSEGRGNSGQIGPATVEQTHTTIQQSGTYEQEHKVRPAESASVTDQGERSRQQGPLFDAAKEQLKMATSIHSITRVYPEGAKDGASVGQRRRRSMSLPSENLEDFSLPSGPPSMGMSTTGRSRQYRTQSPNQNIEDISMPSGPPSMYATRGTSSPRNSRQRSVQNVDDISPISFASTIPSIDSTSRRGSSGEKYRSTSSRGLSGLANYAPFLEQIRSRTNSLLNACHPCDPCSPCCPTVQNVESTSDHCDPCAGFNNSNRTRKHGSC
ncbi:proline-rich protein 36 [Eurosta solidaginis]|uniref:proline-rich protein 36 n=1 Tax=Eurosta solidaginis TaxID=178769 RepID=UPI0035314129